MWGVVPASALMVQIYSYTIHEHLHNYMFDIDILAYEYTNMYTCVTHDVYS